MKSEGGSGTCSFPLAGSCDTRASGYICIDYYAASSAGLDVGCKAGGGTWSTTTCAHSDALGGCLEVNSNTCNTAWTYPESKLTVDSVKNMCTKGTFQNP